MDYSLSALSILRNPQLTLKWYVVPLLLIVMYIYTKEAHEKNWNVILGGIALWAWICSTKSGTASFSTRPTLRRLGHADGRWRHGAADSDRLQH